MSKSENNVRHRLIRIYQMLMRDSDMQNPMIITDILPKLEQEYGIETCRDSVREAIETGRRISFQYTDYDGERNRVLRHDGQIYVFSPWVLIWDGDYYYMLGWSDDHEKTTTFYRWPFGWGWDGSIAIIGPDEVVRQYKKMLRKAMRKQTLQ